MFSLEGCGGGLDRKLEDFILEEAQTTFSLRLGKPLAIYPEEYLAKLFLKEHQKNLKDDLRVFLADPRLMRGLSEFDYEELIASLKDPQAQRDAGRVLMAFYRYKNLSPRIPTERGERLRRAFQDILEAGYEGIFCGASAIYAGMAQVLNELYGRNVWPLGAVTPPKPAEVPALEPLAAEPAKAA